MIASTNSTLAATLIATAAGVGAWFLASQEQSGRAIRKLALAIDFFQ